MADPIQHPYSRQGLRAIFNALPLTMMVFNKNLLVTLVNDTALTFTRKNRDQILGHAAGDALDCVNRNDEPKGCGFGLSCTTCRLRATLTDAIRTGEARTRVESAMDLQTRGVRILRFSTLPLTIAENTAVLLTIEDLTDARRYEEQQMEKEKLAAVLETTGGICHELSQPLQVIMGYCEILSGRKDLDREAGDALTAVNLEIAKIARLVHDLNNITHYRTKPYLSSKIIDIEESSTPSKR